MAFRLRRQSRRGGAATPYRFQITARRGRHALLFQLFIHMWLVCQIGAREHYGIARGLQRAGRLGLLVTDFWIPPGSMAGGLPGAKRLADRFHTDLAAATVTAPNTRMLGFELLARLRGQRGWERVMRRNALFQREALKILAEFPHSPAHLTPMGTSGRAQRTPPTVTCPPSPVPCLFSYSYAALELFRYAKQRGWTTVLGQIDPGPGEDVIVRRLRMQHPEWVGPNEQSAPDDYWDRWREECDLADRIVVNSAWSRALLIEAGIDAGKIEVVPLAFEEEGRERSDQGSGVRGQTSELPSAMPVMDLPIFSEFADAHAAFRPPASGLRPLRVLWLGQVNVRKGIQDLVAAARMLEEVPHTEHAADGGEECRNGGGQDARATVARASCPEPLSNISYAGNADLAGTSVCIDVVGPHGPLPPGLPDNMVFHGACTRTEAGDWYSKADVFVLPTHSDGFALTQLEAMAHGVPVIATPCCGEVVDDSVNGWLVPAGDPKALAERIHWIADNRQCLEPMRNAASLTAAKFGLDRMAKALDF